MKFLKTNFYGDSNIGLYGFATDDYCFLGLKTKVEKKIEKTLGVKIFISSVFETQLPGIFIAGNSSGLIVPKILEDYEFKSLKKFDTLKIETRYTALGNLVLMNDNGIILSPLLRNEKSKIENFFKIPCKVTTIAGLNVVGSLAITTNRGCLVCPKIREKEKAIIEGVLNVPVNIGTVSFGSSFVKSGIIANSNGFLASGLSSGPELGRINEALGFL